MRRGNRRYGSDLNPFRKIANREPRRADFAGWGTKRQWTGFPPVGGGFSGGAFLFEVPGSNSSLGNIPILRRHAPRRGAKKYLRTCWRRANRQCVHQTACKAFWTALGARSMTRR